MSSAQPSSLYVPPELLREIFSHCDQPTLAVVSRVSFACLELSSRFLYGDVVLSDRDSVMSLFRLPEEDFAHSVRSTRVKRHISRRLIDSITLFVEDGDEVDLDDLHEDAVRPLNISVLCISVTMSRGFVQTRPCSVSGLLELVNPEMLVLSGRPTLGWPAFITTHNPDYEQQCLDHWDALDTIIVSNALFDDESEFIAWLYPPDADRPIRLLYDLLQRPDGEEHDGFQSPMALDFGTTSAFNADRDYPLEMRALVKSEDAKEEVEGEVKEQDFGGHKPLGETCFVDVASERITRLMEDITLGVWNGMDWDALDELPWTET